MFTGWDGLAAFVKLLKRNKRILFVTFGVFLLLHNRRVFTFFLGTRDGVVDFSQLEYFDDVDAKSDNLAQTREIDFSITSSNTANAATPLCPNYPPYLVGNVTTSALFMKNRSWLEIINDNAAFSLNGRFSPANCRARHKVAVIIPLRGRETQLRILLSHMLPIWQRQQIEFGVYTITQAGNHLFNRAKLMNVGVAEAKKDCDYDCYVFHDVDLLLEDDRCLYWCHEENPRHLAMYMDKFSYEPLTYTTECNPFGAGKRFPYFGGISMLSRRQFADANGFSNLFWGWGGEDDDVYFRLLSKGYSMANPYDNKCSFKMIPHDHESSNLENKGRYSLLRYSVERMEKEGFRSLKYKLISKENKKVYTNITVDIGKATPKMINFMSEELPWIMKCIAKMPWE